MKHIYQRFCPSSFIGVSLSLTIMSLCFQTARVQLPSTTWIAGTADWKYFGNWNNGVPTDSIRALINNGGTARVFTAGAAANYVGLGEAPADQGSLEITGGQLAVNFMRIGLEGEGAMAIHNGGKLTSRFGTVGSSGSGMAEVGGSNSTWLITPGTANDAGFDVGQFGPGSLYIHDGGTVSYTYAPNQSSLAVYNRSSAECLLAAESASSSSTAPTRSSSTAPIRSSAIMASGGCMSKTVTGHELQR